MDSEWRISGVPPPPRDLHHLFPVNVHSGWTTAISNINGRPNEDAVKIRHLQLSDSQLGVHRVSSGTTHDVRTLSDGVTKAWEAVYRKGSFKPSGDVKGGFGFYVKGPQGDWTEHLERSVDIVFAYAVRFQEGFDFVKGGKLPGIFGGEGDKAYSCSGGRQNDRCSCFDLRMMWRADGEGELYAYLPLTESNTHRLLAVPGSYQNPDYGFSVGRGSFTFRPGTWATISERVKLNDPGLENGEIQVWVDGKSIMNINGLTLRKRHQANVKGLHFQTFFGGSTSEWASPKKQYAWFSNISGATIT